MKLSYQLPALNSLRFYAAFLVIIFHIKSSLKSNDIFQFINYPVLNKSDEAVSFFFVLSGFLITYLLLHEIKKTNTINVKKFYLRRILRIWPVYFLIIFVGLLLNFFILPKIGVISHSEYKLSKALLLYTFFLPNLFNSFVSVGAILNPIWSIGVEEQFYLFWAPIVKFFHKRLLLILIFIYTAFILLRFAFSFNPFGNSFNFIDFIYTIRFYYMAAGGIGAYIIVKYPQILLGFLFKSKMSQIGHLFLLLAFLFLYHQNCIEGFHFIFIDLFLSYLFIWIIIHFSLNTNRIFNIENKLTEWLGKISYGLYMYHMIIIAVLVFVIQKCNIRVESNLYAVLIILVVVVFAILISSLSYSLFEKSFLKLKVKHQVINTRT